MCKRKYGQNHLFAIKKVKGKFKAITTYERHKNMHVWCYVKGKDQIINSLVYNMNTSFPQIVLVNESGIRSKKIVSANSKALETSKEIDETSQIFHTDMNSNENILTSTHLYSNHSSDFNPSDTINDKSYPKVCEDCTFTGGNEALNGVIKAFQCGFDREKVNKLNLKVNKESINLLNNNSEKINNSNLKEYKENSNFLNNESNNIRNITLEDDIFDLSEINQVKDLSCDFNELSFYETDLHIFEQIMDDTLINNNQTNAVEEIKDLESCNDQKIEQLDCADIVEEEIDNKDENYIPESESEYSDIEYETNAPGKSSCDDTNLIVENSNQCPAYKKMNFCLFCKSLKLKIVRHYLQVHKNEEEVKKFAVLPKQCKERREIIKTLRLRGNFEYNTDNIHNKGDLLVSRRPNFKYPKKGIDYLCCVQCKGFFSKRTYYLHTNKCLKQNCSSNRTVKILGRTIVGRIHEYASETLKKIVFPVLREDDIVRLIRYDELLILYGNKLCLKYKLQQEHLMIRNRLRTLGRFLKILKEINPTVTDFASIFNPLFYDDCIKAVYKIARYDEETQMFKSSYTAFQIGTLLKQVGEFLRSQCIKKQDHAKKALVEDFLLLRNEDYASSVNKTVQETQNHRRREKNPVLPTMNDIKIFNQFLDKTRNEAYCVLETSFSTSMWLTVAETALLSIQTFNRRRAGEIERIAITDFENRKNHSQLTNKETCNQLSKKPEEIKNKYLRFEIRGKKGRTVPVLLDNELEKSVLLLLKYRKQMGIHIKNPYLFALPGFYKNRHKHLHSTDLMRQYADKCGAKYPHLLRGTLLRKHMATNCMKYNLNENDLSALTNFMGHEKSIHKEYYRLTQKEIDITQVSQYLEAAQGNINDESDLNDNSNYSDIEHSDENNNTLQKSGQKSRQVTKRSRWTVKEKDCVLNAFSAYLRKDNCPPVEEIKTLIKANPCLHSRTASQVKSWFNNQQKHARNK